MTAATTRRAYSHGKPFDIAELKKKTGTRREPSPRDIALEKAIRETAAAAASQVVPFYLSDTDKLQTVKLAARRIAHRLELPVNIGSHRAYPNTVLMSRGLLSNRGKRSK